jgi:hypothetical protein
MTQRAGGWLIVLAARLAALLLVIVLGATPSTSAAVSAYGYDAQARAGSAATTPAPNVAAATAIGPPVAATPRGSTSATSRRLLAPEGAASAIDQAASKVPDEWGPGQPARSGGGWRWSDPAEKPGTNYIRVDPGNPDSSDPVQQVDHVHVSSGGVQVANHLPLDQWLQWGSWNAP